MSLAKEALLIYRPKHANQPQAVQIFGQLGEQPKEVWLNGRIPNKNFIFVAVELQSVKKLANSKKKFNYVKS